MGPPEVSPTLGDVVPPPCLAIVAGRVEARIRQLVDTEARRWGAVDPDLAEPVEALGRLILAGGKRLRPAFFYWGLVTAGGDPDDPVIDDVGAALELLHAFALAHDDVVDDSSTRRGRPAVHMDFTDRHQRERWRGEGRRFGEGVAVLVGDLAHVYADMLVTGLPGPAVAVWNELRVELNMGQFLDVSGTARGAVDEATAWRITRLKSAKYTIERPLHLGAAAADGLDRLSDTFTRYGVPLGEAFQLRDDVLGVFGDQVLTGKPVGDDLREGKPTPLLAAACRRADAPGRLILNRVGDPHLTPADIRTIQTLLVDCGALAEVEAAILRRRAEALSALALLEGSEVPADRRATVVEGLTELADFVVRRPA